MHTVGGTIMLRRRHPNVRILSWLLSSFIALCAAAWLFCFPAKQAALAFTLATGVGVNSLQTQIDRLEDKCIKGQVLSESERRFLRDLYSCFAKGGKLVAPQSSKMMHRYLSRTGEDLAVSPELFTRSTPVRKAMAEIRRQILLDVNRGHAVQDAYSSETFCMGDPAYFDSFVGLYFGHIRAHLSGAQQDAAVLSWRAEVPWTWPTYEELVKKYGDYHAQCFSLPNARSVLGGSEHHLRVDDGLGGHLSAIGLAKPFLVFAEWKETLICTP
jgi:hypothetical protein